MSYAAISWSYSDEVLDAGLKPTELAVLRALCWHYFEKDRTRYDRNCFPAVETIAREIGKDVSTVDRAKNVLKEKGLIDWDRAANYGEGEKRSNTYRISCPKLQKMHEQNERKRREGMPPDESMLDREFPPKPGLIFIRPDPGALAQSFAPPLNSRQADWMADALAFVFDKPDHREKLYAAMLRAPDLDTCRKTLHRVIENSKRGRRISNRLGYLLTALRNASKQSPSPRERVGIGPMF